MAIDKDWTDLQGNNINEFITNYRKSLEEQRDADTESAAQTRANAQASIMGAANTSGMMYSNLPARSKLRYDTETYYPTLEKIQSTYQTGLDKLRQNAVDVYNSTRDYEKAIADIEKATAELNKA